MTKILKFDRFLILEILVALDNRVIKVYQFKEKFILSFQSFNLADLKQKLSIFSNWSKFWFDRIFDKV